MRVLVVHNRYRERGGEDVVVEHEVELLRSGGHEVTDYGRHNDEVAESAPLGMALQALWSRRTTQELASLIGECQPEVVHVHNTFPLVSPSVYWVAARAGVPVVQTLHNFRLICPQGLLLREGRPCESCVGRVPLPAVRHACYRGSRAQTAVAAAAVVLHRGLGTWRSKVDRYIALSEFSRGRLIAGGVPAERIVVKPNSVPAASDPLEGPRSGLLFAGRLSAEKGLDTLVRAAAGLPPGSVRVAGSGPMAAALAGVPALQPLGRLDRSALQAEMAGAAALVLPSACYENAPLAVLEAFACGLPVIASRLGALAEIVEDGVTGLLCEPGDAQALQQKMSWALSHHGAMRLMGAAARSQHARLYAPAENLRRLIGIYESVAPTGRYGQAPYLSGAPASGVLR
jgi:glycosyltransferase involved in cell wall biosynthesis